MLLKYTKITKITKMTHLQLLAIPGVQKHPRTSVTTNSNACLPA